MIAFVGVLILVVSVSGIGIPHHSDPHSVLPSHFGSIDNFGSKLSKRLDNALLKAKKSRHPHPTIDHHFDSTSLGGPLSGSVSGSEFDSAHGLPFQPDFISPHSSGSSSHHDDHSHHHGSHSSTHGLFPEAGHSEISAQPHHHLDLTHGSHSGLDSRADSLGLGISQRLGLDNNALGISSSPFDGSSGRFDLPSSNLDSFALPSNSGLPDFSSHGRLDDLSIGIPNFGSGQSGISTHNGISNSLSQVPSIDDFSSGNFLKALRSSSGNDGSHSGSGVSHLRPEKLRLPGYQDLGASSLEHFPLDLSDDSSLTSPDLGLNLPLSSLRSQSSGPVLSGSFDSSIFGQSSGISDSLPLSSSSALTDSSSFGTDIYSFPSRIANIDSSYDPYQSFGQSSYYLPSQGSRSFDPLLSYGYRGHHLGSPYLRFGRGIRGYSPISYSGSFRSIPYASTFTFGPSYKRPLLRSKITF